MKNNIKKLALIIFFFNNNFKIFSGPEPEFINQKQMRQQQREEAQQNKLLYALGGIFSVLIIKKLLNQEAPIVQIQENNPIQENNLIQEIHDEIQLFDMENINPILMDKTNFFKPKNIFMEKTIENLLKQHPNDFFFYVFQKMIDIIYEHKDEIKNIKDLSSKTVDNISDRINILNIALKSSFTMNDIEKLKYRKDYYDKDINITFIQQIKNNFQYIILQFHNICNDKTFIKNEEFQNKILYFFRKNQEKILFFYDIKTVNLTHELLLSSFGAGTRVTNMKTISFYTMLNMYLLLVNNENFLNKINKNPEDKQFILQLIDSEESQRFYLIIKNRKPRFDNQGNREYLIGTKDFDEELQKIKDKLLSK